MGPRGKKRKIPCIHCIVKRTREPRTPHNTGSNRMGKLGKCDMEVCSSNNRKVASFDIGECGRFGVRALERNWAGTAMCKDRCAVRASTMCAGKKQFATHHRESAIDSEGRCEWIAIGNKEAKKSASGQMQFACGRRMVERVETIWAMCMNFHRSRSEVRMSRQEQRDKRTRSFRDVSFAVG